MKWHFIIVIFESKPYPNYSSYTDLLHQLNSIWTPECSYEFSILYDSETKEKTSLLYYNQDGRIERTLPYTLNYSNLLGSFINTSVESHRQRHRPIHKLDSEWKSVFLLYVHGNVWFYKHRNQINNFQHLLEQVRYSFDLIILQSCFTASLENCSTLQSYGEYLITSEYKQSVLFMLTSDIFRLCSTFDTSKELGQFIFKSYIQRTNTQSNQKGWKQEDLIFDLVFLDLKWFQPFYNSLKSLQLNQASYDSYKRSKVYPRIHKDYLNYDIIEVLFWEQKLNKQTWDLYNKFVLLYTQSPYLKRKWWSSRLHGISWAPCPYDSPYYKYYPVNQMANDQSFFVIQ